MESIVTICEITLDSQACRRFGEDSSEQTAVNTCVVFCFFNKQTTGYMEDGSAVRRPEVDAVNAQGANHMHPVLGVVCLLQCTASQHAQAAVGPLAAFGFATWIAQPIEGSRTRMGSQCADSTYVAVLVHGETAKLAF